MYRPSIGPVSAIERAIVCMRMPGLADLRQPISRGFLHTATSGGAPGFFYARCARREKMLSRKFDKVIVTAAPDLIPPPLIHQLKAGGKMVIPAGLPDAQQLVLVEKNGNGKVTTREILQVRFSQLEDTEPGTTSN